MSYVAKDLMVYMSKCFCCRNLKLYRKLYGDNVKKHIYFDRSQRKINRQLDVVNLLKSVRNLRIIS